MITQVFGCMLHGSRTLGSEPEAPKQPETAEELGELRRPTGRRRPKVKHKPLGGINGFRPTMNLRTGHLSNLFSLFLLILGLLFAIVLGSLLATGLSGLFLFASGSELPSFSELANQAMATDLWMSVAEIIRGFGCLGLVALLLTRLDGRVFQFSALGLAWKPNPVLMILSGILVMSALFLGAGYFAAVVGVENGVSSVSLAFSQIGFSGLVVLAISTFANAFWQELAFRAYLQPRLQRSYGLLPGILICSLVFVVLHGLMRPLGGMEVLTGTILFSLVGWLYFVSNSLVLATALHATGNFFLNLFGEVELSFPPHLHRSLVYALGLAVAWVIFRRKVSPGPEPEGEELGTGGHGQDTI